MSDKGGQNGEILQATPWQCGDNDCRQQWHLANFWVYDDGTYTVDKHADGDHETCEESDVPTFEAAEEAWRQYCEHVRLVGEDPLGNFIVPVGSPTPRRWQLRYRDWVGNRKRGIAFVGARRRGRGPWKTPREIPKEVVDYACAEQSKTNPSLWYCPNWTSLADFQQEITTDCEDVLAIRSSDRGGGLLVTCVLDEQPRPWSEKRRAAWLRKKAREYLECGELEREKDE